MTKALPILTSVLLGASIIGVTAVSAQTASSTTKCGPEVFSADKMTYTNVPCPGENPGATAAAKTTQGAQPCQPETWSTDKMAYVSTPCPAGQTYENPGWTGAKPQ
jgi:hypothetical protein